MNEVSFTYPWGERHVNEVRDADLAAFLNHLDGFGATEVIVVTEN